MVAGSTLVSTDARDIAVRAASTSWQTVRVPTSTP
jgi:hypothetical protein